MRLELIVLAVVVGLATWIFRFAPTKLNLSSAAPTGFVKRFLVATGPAAIATLFTASMLPMVTPDLAALVPLGLGIAAVLGVYIMRPSVVLATLAGAAAYGFGVFVLG